MNTQTDERKHAGIARVPPLHPDCTALTPLLLTIPQVAEATNLGRSTVYRELDAGRLRSVKVGARRLVPRAALEDWLATLQAGEQ